MDILFSESAESSTRSFYVNCGGKRLFDIVFSVILLIMFLPILTILTLLIVSTSSGAAFFCDKREAKGGRLFEIFKLRTFFVGTNKKTLVGYLIRPIALDEIPQFFNVLRGDMSLVGPRPHRPQDALRYSQLCATYPKRLAIKPGLTGLAQVRNHFPRTEAHISKMVSSDLEYAERQSFFLDLMILLGTVKILLKGH